MAYRIRLTSPAERKATITKGLESPDKKVTFHHFRNRSYELPVIVVPIDLPIYRMENFRTYTDQHEYIAKEKVASDYFSSGQEKESVQQVQHEMLTRLSKKGVVDSVVPVYDILDKEGQREAILITASGTVVNGNRRLAAMRELLTTHGEMSHIDVMVLPADASADEIVDIEASLQGRPETKLEYDWIGDAQLINRLIEMGRTTKQVALQLHRTKGEIDNARAALAEADLYLKEWAKAEGEYGRVNDAAEQLFMDLPKRLEKKDAALAHASRVIAWSLLDNRKKLTGRVYNYNSAFGALAKDVLNRTATELGLSTSEVPESFGSDDDFDIDVDSDTDAQSYASVINALTDNVSKDNAVDVLISSCITAIEIAKGQKDGDAALKALTEANSKLVSVDLSRASQKTYSGIRKQLDVIDGLVESLKKKLAEIE